MRLRLVALDEFQFLTCIKLQLWGSKNSRFKDWKIGDYIGFSVAKKLAGLAEVSGECFFSENPVWDKDIYPYRIPITFIHASFLEDRDLHANEVKEVLTKAWGKVYGWGIINQSLLSDKAAETIVYAVCAQPNNLTDIETNIDSYLLEAKPIDNSSVKPPENPLKPVVPIDPIIDDPNRNNGTGIEEEEVGDGEGISTPFDPKQIRVLSKSMTIYLLLKRIKHQELDLAPDFQRKSGIWKDGSQSRLIESILIRIPLPSFYIDATNDNKWIVVDGLQRLTALNRFAITQELKLCQLEFIKEHEGKTFKELPRELQRCIEETQLTVYLIEEGTPPDVKFNIFKRINTGGLPLSSQEIRHALHQGKATKFLVELAESVEFQRAVDSSIRDDRMADREFVLRFLAFAITPYTEYYKYRDFDSFLNQSMTRLNKMSKQDFENLKYRLSRSMVAAFDIFGKDAFRKRYKGDAPRSVINKALFESWSINLDKLSDAQIEVLKSLRATVKLKFIELMNQDREFEKAISQGTGDIGKVKRRFSAIEKLIQEVLTQQ